MTLELSPAAREARTRSRWKLLYLLAGLLIFWVLMMLTMYFTTVYPRRHRHEPELGPGAGSLLGSGVTSPAESVAPGLPVTPASRP